MARTPPAPIVALDGTPNADALIITDPDREKLLAGIEARLRDGQGFTLATLNLDHLVKLRRDPAFLAAYRAHSHVVADGNPVVWLSRLAGRRIDLIPGSELIAPLMRIAANTQARVALLGSTEPALRLAAQRMQATHPGLQVVLCHAPSFGFDPQGPAADAAIEALRKAEADLCLIALGAPKQEIFAAYAAQQLPDCGFVSIGAGLDFIAGNQKRAPKWVQAMAMEWFWRMAGNPRRLARRYAECFAILPGLGWQALQERRSGPDQKDG